MENIYITGILQVLRFGVNILLLVIINGIKFLIGDNN